MNQMAFTGRLSRAFIGPRPTTWVPRAVPLLQTDSKSVPFQNKASGRFSGSWEARVLVRVLTYGLKHIAFKTEEDRIDSTSCEAGPFQNPIYATSTKHSIEVFPRGGIDFYFIVRREG
jgi:hypothetical protein